MLRENKFRCRCWRNILYVHHIFSFSRYIRLFQSREDHILFEYLPDPKRGSIKVIASIKHDSRSGISLLIHGAYKRQFNQTTNYIAGQCVGGGGDASFRLDFNCYVAPCIDNSDLPELHYDNQYSLFRSERRNWSAVCLYIVFLPLHANTVHFQ